MRDHSNHKVASRHEAIEALMGKWEFTRRTERVPVARALGRIAATRVESCVTLPSTRISNMDAIAVYFDDFEGGVPDIAGWQRGVQWQFCNTGVAMPEGFDTAIRIEDVDVAPNNETLRAILVAPKERYAATSPVGSVVCEGDVIVRAGEMITDALVAALAQGGHTHVAVTARPRVAYIPTGNELVDPTPNPPLGMNIESNGAMICAKLQAWGALPTRFDIVPDNPALILAALRRAVAENDIVVINAGSSKGSDDYTCELLEREGEVLFHEVSQGPGRHCSFSLLDGVPVIGISGPPVGAEFTADFFVKPFVDLFAGASLEWPPAVRARMLDSCPMHPRPVTVCRRAVLRRDENDCFVAWLADPAATRPVMRGCAEANALVCIGPDDCGWEEGDYATVELRWPYTLPPRL